MIIKFNFQDKTAQVNIQTATFGLIKLYFNALNIKAGEYIGAVVPRVEDEINDMTWFNIMSWSSLEEIEADINGKDTSWVEIDQITIIPDQGKEYPFNNFDKFKTVEITSFGEKIKITGEEYKELSARIKREQISERYLNTVSCLNQSNIKKYLVEETDILCETFDRMLEANTTLEYEFNALERVLMTFAGGYGRYDATLTDGSIVGLILCKRQAETIIDYIGRRFAGDIKPEEKNVVFVDETGEDVLLADILALVYVRKTELDFL